MYEYMCVYIVNVHTHTHTHTHSGILPGKRERRKYTARGRNIIVDTSYSYNKY